jgi:hypothetical protein
MKRCLILKTAVTLVLGLVLADSLSAQDKKAGDQEKSSIWMKAKLEASRNILGALTESDHEKIRTNAEAMAFLGYLEKWARADMPDYKRQVSYFDFANRELIRQAREENLEGATLAYNQLIVSCVQCHRIVRDAKK